MMSRRKAIPAALAISCIASVSAVDSSASPAKPARPEAIKSYCLDFNWAGRSGSAEPRTCKDADPAVHVAWHKAMGGNAIQFRFMVS